MAPTGSPSTPPSVQEQVGTFIANVDVTAGQDAPADALLYSVWGGGNDARDAAVAMLTSGDANAAFPYVSAFVNSLASSIQALALEGANTFLVPNIPDLGKIPAIIAAGNAASNAVRNMTAVFNASADAMLDNLQNTLAINIIKLDTFAFVDNIVMQASSFGFTNVTNACAANPACIADPDGYFFWDGIHPTNTGHLALYEAASDTLDARNAAVPEPATVFLFILGMAVIFVMRRCECL